VQNGRDECEEGKVRVDETETRKVTRDSDTLHHNKPKHSLKRVEKSKNRVACATLGIFEKVWEVSGVIFSQKLYSWPNKTITNAITV
jgi:hypothetical protein